MYTPSPTALAPERLAPEAVFFKLAPQRLAPETNDEYKLAPTEKLAPSDPYKYDPARPPHKYDPSPTKYDPSPHRVIEERVIEEKYDPNATPYKYDPNATPYKAAPMHRRPAPDSSSPFFVNF